MFVSASAQQAREQTACGARVIGPLGTPGAPGAADARAQVEAARAARPLEVAEIRALLRDIFASHATPARLAALARAAGLPAELIGGRQIAVLARAAGAADAAPLARALLGQRLRPAEVVVATAAEGAVRGALAGLSDHGSRGGIAAAPAGQDGPDWPRPLARLATSPWLAPWTADARQPDTYLLDLACARECAAADAVGFGAAEYEFTRWLDEPALARRDLLAPGGPAAGDWGSHGLRLFTITRADAQ